MAMTVIWTGMTVGALVFSLALGNQAELAPAALDSWASPWPGFCVSGWA